MDIYLLSMVQLNKNLFTYLTKDAEKLLNAFHEKIPFSGPTIYFHEKAIETSINDWERKTEYVYAVLTAWGMNRLGKKGAKLRKWCCFENSFLKNKDLILDLSNSKLSNMTDKKWDEIETLFKNLKIMKSGPVLVGNSKALHHFLPHLFIPVDRSYTLRMLYDSTYIGNSIEAQWNKYKEILKSFAYPVLNEIDKKLLKKWKNESLPMCTSELKIIDNLIIGKKLLDERN